VFEVHVDGFTAAAKEENGLTEVSTLFHIFWPLWRDMILIVSQLTSVSDVVIISFVERYRQSIEPMTWTQWLKYFRAFYVDRLH
jgi:hypothetical protein